MNVFQLVLRQMRQRALSTSLTILSVMLGVALAVAVLIVRRESGNLFGQTDYGYDVLVGAKASPLQLVLNTVYHLDRSPGNIPYSLYESMIREPRYRTLVRMAVPFAVGDTYRSQRIVATSPRLFGVDDEGQPLDPERVLEYRPGRRYTIAEGRVFHPRKFEAIVGSDVRRLTGLKIGEKFQATHGMPSPGREEDVHGEEWTVVGVLEPTYTAADRCLYIPLTTFYAIGEHEDALQAMADVRAGRDPRARTASTLPTTQPTSGYTINPDGTIELHMPRDQWMISGIMVKSRSPAFGMQLMYAINNRDAAAAVNPASEMRKFFETFLRPGTLILGAVAWLVLVVAAVGILVSIYNAISARMRDIAIVRALGATRRRVLAMVCLEAGLIGLIGGVLGVVLGHALAGVGSILARRFLGESIAWLTVGKETWIYLVGAVVLAVLAGLVPALKAYRTPVASNLAG
jgi:putative ABC transport system permease protein